MAKETTNQDDLASQKSRRKPLTIDLPAEEVGRKPVETGATSESSSASSAAASSAAASVGAAASVVDPPKPQPGEPSTAEKNDKKATPPDPVIPSAFAAAEGHSGRKTAKPDVTPSQSNDRPAGSFAAIFVAAIVGGAIVAAVVAALARGGYFAPATDTNAADTAAEVAGLKSEVAALEQARDGLPALRDKLAALQKTVDAFANSAPVIAPDPAALKDMQDRIAKLESATSQSTATSNLEPRIAALTKDVAALKAAVPPDTSSLQSGLASLKQQVDALSATVNKLPQENRIAAIETKLGDTSARIDSAAALAPAVAADALAAALDAGRPFHIELAALKSLGVDSASVDALTPEAEVGLPTIVALRAEFELKMDSIASSEPIPENTGTIDRLLQSAQGLVTVRPAHPTAGTNPEAIVSRIRGALAAGDLKAALGEWDTLPNTLKDPTADWAKVGKARIVADDLVAEVRSAALSKLSAGK